MSRSGRNVRPMASVVWTEQLTCGIRWGGQGSGDANDGASASPNRGKSPLTSNRPDRVGAATGVERVAMGGDELPVVPKGGLEPPRV